MATLRIDVDEDTLDRLARAAVAERRPVVMHAEVVLRRALGLPFPSGAGDSGSIGQPLHGAAENDDAAA